MGIGDILRDAARVYVCVTSPRAYFAALTMSIFHLFKVSLSVRSGRGHRAR